MGVKKVAKIPSSYNFEELKIFTTNFTSVLIKKISTVLKMCQSST